MFKKKKNRSSFIKNTFCDVSLLYKNLINWNLAKITILLWSIVLWFIAIIPFIIIFFIYSFFSDIGLLALVSSLLSGVLLPSFFANILLVLIVFVYFIAFSYSNFLLARVNNSYLDWKKVEIKKNDYFDFKKILTFFNLSLLNIALFTVPVLVFFLFMFILFISSGDIDQIKTMVNTSPFNYFSILSLVFLIVTLLSLLYIFYRVVFSYFVLADSKKYKKTNKTIYYLKESFKKTKSFKSFLSFFLVFFIFLLILSPINYIWKVLENNWDMLNDYVVYSSLNEWQKEYITWERLYYYEGLKADFWNLSNDEINSEINKNFVLSILFTIFSFVFLHWLFVMIFSSFYKREL